MTHFTRKPYELGSRISAAPIGPSREPGEFAEDPGWRERLSSYINHSVLRARSEDGGVTLESIAEEFHLTRERIRQIEAGASARFRMSLEKTLTHAERAAGFTIWDVYGPES